MEKKQFSPYFVTELDEESYSLPNREERECFLNAVIAKAEFQIEDIKTVYKYDFRKTLDRKPIAE